MEISNTSVQLTLINASREIQEATTSELLDESIELMKEENTRIQQTSIDTYA
jgi:hypothetical protein